jgi:hypothetical protein
MRQLNDEPKLVYEVGLIRQKGKAIAREVQQSLHFTAQVKTAVFMDILTLS